MKVTISDISLPKTGVLVFAIGKDKKLEKTAKSVDAKSNGVITRAIKSGMFEGKKHEVLSIVAPEGIGVNVLILAGLGDVKQFGQLDAQKLGGKIYDNLVSVKQKEATLIDEGSKPCVDFSAYVAYGVVLKSYRVDKYKTLKEKIKKPAIVKLVVATDAKKKVSDSYKYLSSIADGVFLARDVVSDPPNKLYPKSYAQRVKSELTKLGAKVTILSEKQMEKLRMGALLGVGQGSVFESQLVVIEWKGAKNKNERPVSFVGKGVTFDTGGISIKPSLGMEDMKYDMGGSAAVVGVMKALAGRKAKVNAVGVVGLVENMPDGNAQRPSDIVTSMSGQTIEVLNTDAEGRLVLADALWYTQEKFKPKFVVNLATLTGAIIISLGDEHAGLFSNDDNLSKQLLEAGIGTDEKLWRFPLAEAYDKLLDSPIADMQNISAGRGAGSITAAQFLQRFIKKDVPWAHLDIAGTAWSKKPKAFSPKGATGFGVRLLNELVKNYYEK